MEVGHWILGFSIATAVLAVILLVWTVIRSREIRELESKIREEVRADRESRERLAREDRTALQEAMASHRKSMEEGFDRFARSQREATDQFGTKLGETDQRSEERLERIRKTVEERLEILQKGNETKLEAMRRTVDETLQSTLEKRLGESFKLVAGRLEAVQRGLGEMQELAQGVGDLKRVLTNVKARGTWGEVQLEALLEQILAPGQFERNVAIRPGRGDRVEFAIRLPGRDPDKDESVWLPIDAKFPQEDYLRLQTAMDEADPTAIQTARTALVRAIKQSAKTIRDKYVEPPHSTDFAILYLPTEGLFAEAIRADGLAEEIQRDLRIVLAGPTTLAALLNSLQMGFRTLALEKRSSEVWNILASVKTEFRKFGDVIAKVQRQIKTAARTLDETEVRTRAMERKLKDVEVLPEIEEAPKQPTSLLEDSLK